MGFSLVAGQKAHVSSSNSISLPSNVTGGNLVVIGIAILNFLNEPVVTDGNGFVLETLGYVEQGGSRGIYIAVALNSSGATRAYTIRFPAGGTARDAWAYEFAPSGGVSVYDAIATALSIGTNDASATLSLTGAPELAYAVIVNGNTPPTAASSPWTLGTTGLSASDEYDLAALSSITTGWTPPSFPNAVSALGIKVVPGTGIVKYVNSNLSQFTNAPVSPQTVTGTFTVSPGTDCAFAYLLWDAASGSPAVTAVTLGGRAMTACGPAAHDTVANVFCQIWFLVAPTIATGQHLVITFTGTMSEIYTNVTGFQGVDQTTPVRSGTYQNVNGNFTGGAYSTTISSNANDLTTTLQCMGGTEGTNQAMHGINENGINEMAHDRGAIPGSSVTHTWSSVLGSSGTGSFALAGFSIKAAALPTNILHSIDAYVIPPAVTKVALSVQVDKQIVRTLRDG